MRRAVTRGRVLPQSLSIDQDIGVKQMVSRMTLWRRANPQKAKLGAQRDYQHRRQQQPNLACIKNRKLGLQYRQRLRSQILDLLGHKCAVCGFSDPRALQIDHIKGGGYRERQRVGVDNQYRRILEVKGEGYQLLCANCNQIKKYVNKENRHRAGANATTLVSEKTQQFNFFEDLCLGVGM